MLIFDVTSTSVPKVTGRFTDISILSLTSCKVDIPTFSTENTPRRDAPLNWNNKRVKTPRIEAPIRLQESLLLREKLK